MQNRNRILFKRYTLLPLLTSFFLVISVKGECRIFVDRFKPDNQNLSLSVIASETSLMFQKKLKTVNCKTLFYTSYIKPDAELVDSEIHFKEFLNREQVDYILSGQVLSFGIDSQQQIKGAKFLGMSRYPVNTRINAVLYSVKNEKIVYNKTLENISWIPRFTFFGLHRKIKPTTPRLVDLFIHEPVILHMRNMAEIIEKVE